MNKQQPMSNGLDTYRYWHCRAFGDYHDLTLESASEAGAKSPLGPRQLRLANHAFAVGFPDMLMVQGLYQLKPALPFSPCTEFVASVLETGSEVEAFQVGDRVMGSVRVGAACEQIIASADDCLALPPSLDPVSGAGYLVAYKTAYVALVERGQVSAADTVLIHGAAGGVGLAAVDLAKALGATVIAMATGAEKLGVLEQHGADHVIDYADGEFRHAVKALTGGRGADVIYDPVGGDVFDQSMRCIAPFGRLLVIGFTSGRIPTLAVNYALIKQVSIIGVRAGEYGRLDPVAGARVKRALGELAASGTISPHVHARLPFTGLIEAFDMIASREVIGRIVIEC